MECDGRRLVWCPEHLTVWCVPGACEGVEMYHEGCGVRLQPLQGVGEHDHVQRAVVFWFNGPGRNEVRACDRQ
jgi:hypothetical protein